MNLENVVEEKKQTKKKRTVFNRNVLKNDKKVECFTAYLHGVPLEALARIYKIGVSTILSWRRLIKLAGKPPYKANEIQSIVNKFKENIGTADKVAAEIEGPFLRPLKGKESPKIFISEALKRHGFGSISPGAKMAEVIPNIAELIKRLESKTEEEIW